MSKEQLTIEDHLIGGIVPELLKELDIISTHCLKIKHALEAGENDDTN